VLTIENSRSSDEMIVALSAAKYRRDIGAGVYDVHSPVVPPVDFLAAKISSALAANVADRDPRRIWVNPGALSRRAAAGDRTRAHACTLTSPIRRPPLIPLLSRRLRAEDARLERGAAGAAQHGAGSADPAQRVRPGRRGS